MELTTAHVDYFDPLFKTIEILESTNSYNNDLKGNMISETKNMLFIINEKKEIKKIPKKGIKILKVNGSGGDYFISGESLSGRPEDRILNIK
ncbi:MAG: ribonuclease P protein subunit [Thermoproteota archaeon]|nr:ribonuclease P protein subunit [Thermoproteota archaeon]